MIDFFFKSINEKQKKVLRIYQNLAAINYKGECIKPYNYGSVMYPLSLAPYKSYIKSCRNCTRIGKSLFTIFFSFS